MTLWRLEWLRLVRTRRLVAVVGVFAFFGLLGPVTARYLADILGAFGAGIEGATIELPPPTPADGFGQYVSNANQLGVLVVVIVAAGALVVDAVPEMGVFLRTRVQRSWRLLAPRLAVTTAVVAVGWTVGVALAWYETWALIGAPRAAGVVVGCLLGSAFLAFVVAVVAVVATRARSVLGTVLVSIVVLAVLPIVGVVDAIGRWLPTRLAGALPDLAGGAAAAGDFAGALVVTALLTAALVAGAIALADRREL